MMAFGKRVLFPLFLGLAVITFSSKLTLADLSPDEISQLIRSIKQVDGGGKGHAAAQQAILKLQTGDATDLPAILAGMNGANPVAMNWLQNVIEHIVDKSDTLPNDNIMAFLLDRKNESQPRRLAYDLLLARDSKTEDLLADMLDDPSLDLRWMAVEQLVAKTEKLSDDGQKKESLRQALSASRDTEQVDRIVAALGKLGEKIKLLDHYAFLTKWRLIGPFDNVGQKGFDVAYPPEADLTSEKFDGKNGEVTWKEHLCTADDGVIKLTEIYGPEKGAIVYALSEFVSDREQPAEIRVGCINACKAWLNGKPIMSHEKYHQAMMVDQYTAPVTLQPGKNTILLKVCQNEQTEPWAQDWMFQVRVTTPEGVPLGNHVTQK